jgi:hypothetical protein
MKKSLRFIVFLVAASVGLMTPRLVLAASFEGNVKMKMQPAKGDPSTISYSMKGQKLRMELPTGKETMISLLDWDKREMSMLMPGQTMYMVIELKDVPQIEKEVKEAQDSTSLEKTSETAKILGRDTTKYIARDGTTVTELWLASGIGSWFNMSGGGNPMKPKKMSDWEKEIISKQLFPLRMVMFDKKGKQTMTTEVIELTPKKLDDSLFVPPAGYTRFNMGGLLKGLGGQ